MSTRSSGRGARPQWLICDHSTERTPPRSATSSIICGAWNSFRHRTWNTSSNGSSSRPRVPDSLLKRVVDVSVEDLLDYLRDKGFNCQVMPLALDKVANRQKNVFIAKFQ